MTISKFDLFLDLMTSSMTSKIHICVKFGVDCFNGATGIVNITDRQTDRQTNRQTNILAKIENFGK